MSFQYPWLLLLLVAPAALLVWVWRRSDRRLVLPFDHGAGRSGWGWRILLSLAESLPALILAVAVLLAAGPQKLGPPVLKPKLTNIQLCVDISYSMTTPFGEGSRYDTAMKAADDFCTYRRGDAFGLTFFGNSYMHWCPLTTDVSAIKCSLPFMRPELVPPWFNGTEIGRALRGCKTLLADRPEGDRMILLITDGESADLFNGNEVTIAKELKDAGITVFAVIIGMERIQDEIAHITGTTGGEAFEAGDPEALRTIFQRIDKMTQAKVEPTIADVQDDFFTTSAAGLGLLAAGLLALFGIRYTPW